MRDQDVEDRREAVAATARELTGPENLALLYQGILTTIVRMRTERQPIFDLPAFRKGMLDTLGEIKREATRLGYSSLDREDATYAVIAFLDETVLNFALPDEMAHHSGDSGQSRWSPLHAELFGKAVAGEQFFVRLDQLRERPNSSRLADTLEVFLLCLLLGYRGRYGRVAPGELRMVTEGLGARIEQIRGSEKGLSPSGIVPLTGVPPPKQQPAFRIPRWLVVALMFGSGAATWLVCRIHLNSIVSGLLQLLQLE